MVKLLNESDANQVIDNVNSIMREMSKDYGNNPNKDYTGGSEELNNLIEMWINSVGPRVTGSALEEARKKINLRNPYFYYEANESTVQGAYAKDIQDDYNEIMENELSKLIEIVLDLLENEESFKNASITPEPTAAPVPPAVGVKRTKQEIKEDYRKKRRQLQQIIRRRAKKGIDLSTFGIKTPAIPKRITEGSIRRLIRMINKAKRIK